MDWSVILLNKKGDKKSELITENLNSLLFLVDSIKSDFDLDKVFRTVGENLQKINVSTVVSIYDKSNNEFKIKHFFSDNTELINFFSQICQLSEKNFFSTQDYEEVYKDQTKKFCALRIDTVAEKYNISCNRQSICRLKSIIVPMVLQGEFLGFIEYISDDLTLVNTQAFERFTQNLVKSITNILLYSEFKKTGERYKDIFENAKEGFFILDPSKKKFTEVNSAITSISGYTAEELKQMNFILLFSENERANIDDKLKRIINNTYDRNDELNFETEITTKTKEKKFVEIKICRIISKHEWFMIMVDITESKKLLEKVEKAKLQNETIIDTISDALFVIDEKYRITNFNRKFQQSVNIPESQIKNSQCFEILNLFEYGLFAEICGCENGEKDFLCEIKKVFNSKQPYVIEKKVQHQGIAKYFRIKIFPSINNKNQVFQVVLLISDVTETRRAEENIRSLQQFQEKILNNIPVSILVIDKDKKIISHNSFAEKLMGKHIQNRILTEAKEIKNNARICQKYNILMEKGKAFYNEDLSYTERKTNAKKHLSILAVPLFDEHLGNIEGAISMAVDDTEEINAKIELEDLNKNLEKQIAVRTQELNEAYLKISQLLELKTKFIADASHELRTPMTIIQGNLDLAIREEEQRNHAVPELYDIIKHEVTQVSGILSDLTMLSNADAGAESILSEKVDLAKVIQNAALSMKIIADDKDIDLINKNKFKTLEIMGDEAKLERMLLNLLRNAIKYNNHNGKVSINTEKSEHEITISVSDNGIGIPEKDLPFIFERFYRVDKSRSRNEGGTGLGLPICKWIAEAHGGHIDVRSELGVGTTFTIHFPIDLKNRLQKEKV